MLAVGGAVLRLTLVPLAPEAMDFDDTQGFSMPQAIHTLREYFYHTPFF